MTGRTSVLTALIIGALGFSALMARSQSSCIDMREDVNQDCVVNSIDLLDVALAYGTVPPEATWTSIPTPLTSSTPTPSTTPTPSSTSTAATSSNTNTPTMTATVSPSATATLSASGSAYSVEDLIAYTTGQSDGTLCPPVDSYDWGIRGHGLSGNPPSGDQITGWWTAQAVSCGTAAPNTVITIQNWRVLGWTGTAWFTYPGAYDDWCATTDPNTSTGLAACTRVGGGFLQPTGQRALHGATNRTAKQNVLCLVTIYEARATGPVMMNAGADSISGGNIQGDMFISRYIELSTALTTVGGSSCTAAVLRQFPPPF